MTQAEYIAALRATLAELATGASVADYEARALIAIEPEPANGEAWRMSRSGFDATGHGTSGDRNTGLFSS